MLHRTSSSIFWDGAGRGGVPQQQQQRQQQHRTAEPLPASAAAASLRDGGGCSSSLWFAWPQVTVNITATTKTTTITDIHDVQYATVCCIPPSDQKQNSLLWTVLDQYNYWCTPAIPSPLLFAHHIPEVYVVAVHEPLATCHSSCHESAGEREDHQLLEPRRLNRFHQHGCCEGNADAMGKGSNRLTYLYCVLLML